MYALVAILAIAASHRRSCVSGRSELQDTLADLRAQLQAQAGQLQSQAGQLESAAALEGALTEQQRQVDRLHSELLEQQQANDHLQREAKLAHIQLEESREAFRVRLQHCMLEVCPCTPCHLTLAHYLPVHIKCHDDRLNLFLSLC